MSTRRRIIVMTGATSGLVRQSALDLAAAGHDLVLIGRSEDRATKLARDLPEARAIAADLSTRGGIEIAAKAVQAEVDQVDTLVNGAGVMLPRREVTVEGFEMNFAVHHLAPFSLTAALLEELLRGDRRVVNVNSAGHHTPLRGSGPVVVDFSDLQHERSYDPFLAYSRTKLANLLFTYELGRRYPELTVAAVHPGMVRSDLGRHFNRVQVTLARAMSSSTQSGADPVTHLAATPEIVGSTYYDRFTPTASSRASYDLESARRLWDISEQLRGPFSP